MAQVSELIHLQYNTQIQYTVNGEADLPVKTCRGILWHGLALASTPLLNLVSLGVLNALLNCVKPQEK